ncbi:hypoxanthine-guanine phosphoribosyltransferase [Hahella aquimaris]|uniref:hypoxanthine-guanine phosphoribosyltransferase n=1 Tax=Hahella sp. HNIBRBA332 TaxID=3015983 RepID=UPI00273B3BD5|nr:hypoxanthine-guanine phosphoribosyltransferase [Hahella sp. HNIBRBA332]WLQ12453.1 hypoxanthine-guanine phosphoribosyltransferase [Hahella sp. HNIBRBA332]
MSHNMENMQQVFQEADRLFDEAQVDQAIERLAQEITAQLKDSNPLVYCVMTGGVVFAGKLLPKLRFPLEVSYIHATRYNNQTSGGGLRWKVEPAESLEGRTVLILDDILDEGATLHAICDYCQDKQPEKVYTAVLVDKQHERKVYPGQKCDFTGLEVADRYIFGYGMDYKGYWRNAPGIYAVKGL